MTLHLNFIWFTCETILVSSLISFFKNTFYYRYLKLQNNKNQSFSLRLSNLQIKLKPRFNCLDDAGYQRHVTTGSTVNCYDAESREVSIDETDIQQILQKNVFNGLCEFCCGTFVTGFSDKELKKSIGDPMELNGDNPAFFLRPDIELLFQELRFLFGGFAVGIILLSFISTLLVARLLTQPIIRLTAARGKWARKYLTFPWLLTEKMRLAVYWINLSLY